MTHNATRRTKRRYFMTFCQYYKRKVYEPKRQQKQTKRKPIQKKKTTHNKTTLTKRRHVMTFCKYYKRKVCEPKRQQKQTKRKPIQRRTTKQH